MSWTSLQPAGSGQLLEVDDLRTSFPRDGRFVRVVDGVSLSVARGETLALVGESGSGKSVTALSIMGLIDRPGRVEDGSRIVFDGHDLLSAEPAQLRQLRGNDISMIFQEPMSSLNPVMRVGDQIAGVLRAHTTLTGTALEERCVELLGLVGIASPERRVREYPHQLSGGMRQRVMIAMAISCNPQLLIADEPTTALDITVQAQILRLLQDLRDRLGMAMLLITHDLTVVAQVADRVAVMYAGRSVELGPVAETISSPKHPYTQALLESVPLPDMDRNRRLNVIPGLVPSPGRWGTGCRFAPRCSYAGDRCRAEDPALVGEGDRAVACWMHTAQGVGATSR